MCYYMITIDTDNDTGASWIENVQFLGCDAGFAPQAGGPGAAPPPHPSCPTAQQSAANAFTNVNQTAPGVFADIGADPNAPNGKEDSGFVYSDGQGNFSWDTTAGDPVNLNAAGQRNRGVANPPAGWTTVGSWHTHPHNPNINAAQTDDQTGTHFSVADEATANTDGFPMYVAVMNASIPGADPQLHFYQYDPATGQETHPANNVVGNGGC
jgi:hypothetical protein